MLQLQMVKNLEDSELSVDTQKSVKEIKGTSRMQVNDNVVKEFEGLMTIVKDKMQETEEKDEE